VRADKCRRRAARTRRHFLPQADGGIGVVSGARGEFQSNQIGFIFILAAVWQGHQQPDPDIGKLYRAAVTQHRADLARHIDRIGFGNRLAAVLTQRMGDFMADDGGKFIIGELKLLNQAAVDNDFAARSAVGIDGFSAICQSHCAASARNTGACLISRSLMRSTRCALLLS